MVAKQLWHLACDKCGRLFNGTTDTATDLRGLAERGGWATGKGAGADVCSNCRSGGSATAVSPSQSNNNRDDYLLSDQVRKDLFENGVEIVFHAAYGGAGSAKVLVNGERIGVLKRSRETTGGYYWSAPGIYVKENPVSSALQMVNLYRRSNKYLPQGDFNFQSALSTEEMTGWAELGLKFDSINDSIFGVSLGSQYLGEVRRTLELRGPDKRQLKVTVIWESSLPGIHNTHASGVIADMYSVRNQVKG